MVDEITDALPPLHEVDRLRLSCGECGVVLVDSMKRKLPYNTNRVSSIIEVETLNHEENTGHLEPELTIDKMRNSVREIDCTVTINE